MFLPLSSAPSKHYQSPCFFIFIDVIVDERFSVVFIKSSVFRCLSLRDTVEKRTAVALQEKVTEVEPQRTCCRPIPLALSVSQHYSPVDMYGYLSAVPHIDSLLTWKKYGIRF